jgi:adenosylcobinamide-phosphate synthase
MEGTIIIPLAAGYILDLLLGDPERLPHPVRLFGWLIGKGERLLNRPPAACKPMAPHRPSAAFLKGMAMVVFLCGSTYLSCRGLLELLWAWSSPLYLAVSSIGVFYGLANRQLIMEGVQVFTILQTMGVEAGRGQLSRIVGRDTGNLTPQQIRIAVLETMSENLGDGVIAPLFYYALAGVPGMLTYKMINTMDSMIGYQSERYEQFGKFAARLDDVANFIPARLAALLMVIVAACQKDRPAAGRRDAFTGPRDASSERRDALRGAGFIRRYGHRHKSPNAGYPEAALAGILDARFGGPNVYHGRLVDKPYIGANNREIGPEEITKVGGINNGVCLLMVSLIILFTLIRQYA